jgi:hypothetical protein
MYVKKKSAACRFKCYVSEEHTASMFRVTELLQVDAGVVRSNQRAVYGCCCPTDSHLQSTTRVAPPIGYQPAFCFTSNVGQLVALHRACDTDTPYLPSIEQ